MRPVSNRFLEVVRKSHRVCSEVWVHAPNREAVRVPVSEGTVTLDASSAVRGRCDIQVEGTDWIPSVSGDKLSPFGAELEVRRGIVFPDGSRELVTLGWFGVEDTEITDDGVGATVRVAALDRAERIVKSRFEDGYQVANGTLYTQAILDVVQGAWPDCPIQTDFVAVSPMTSTLLPTAQQGDDRWEFAQGLAFAIGHNLFFDGDGVLSLRRFASQSSVFEVFDSEVLLSVSRNWSRTAAFNKVVVTGENASSGSVFKGEATDTDPQSPTVYGGPFGKVPEFRSYPMIESDSQATTVAQKILAQEIGVPATVSFSMVPNPALEPDDTITIRRTSAGVYEDHVLSSVTIGLGSSEAMSGTTRERRVL